MVIWKGILKIAEGKRDVYIKEILDAGFIEEFTKQPGNVFYNIGASVSNENELIVVDGWDSRETFEAHDTSKKVDEWREIYSRYVVDCDSVLYEF